jgi:hypothetical protein
MLLSRFECWFSMTFLLGGRNLDLVVRDAGHDADG